jgi:hypothetical protein
MPRSLQPFMSSYATSNDPTKSLGINPFSLVTPFPDPLPDILSGIDYFINLVNQEFDLDIPDATTVVNDIESLLSGFGLTGGAGSFLSQLISAGGGSGSTLSDFGSLFEAIGLTITTVADDFISLFTGTTGGLSGTTGLGSIFTDIEGLLGNPTALGSGSPVLPGISSIPLLSGLTTLLSGFTFTGAGSLLSQLITAAGGSGSSIGDFGTLFDDIAVDATSIINALEDPTDATNFISEVLQQFIGPNSVAGDLLLGPDTPLNADNIFNEINPALLSLVPVSAVGDASINYLANPGFDTIASLIDQGSQGWTWNGSDGHSNNGCAEVTANGVLKTLESNAIPVTTNQLVPMSIWVKWLSATSTLPSSNDLQLNARAYVANGAGNLTLVSTTLIQAIQSPSGNSSNSGQNNFEQLSGQYTVPSNVDHVSMQLAVSTNVTAGTIEFDDGTLSLTGLMAQNLIANLPTDLTSITTNFQTLIDDGVAELGGGGVGNAISVFTDLLSEIPGANILGLSGSGQTVLGNLQTLIDDGIAELGGGGTGNPISAFTGLLGEIPFSNVLGALGPGNIGATIQANVDAAWQGLTGGTTTGNSFGNLSNAATGLLNLANNAQTVGTDAANTLVTRAVTKPAGDAVDQTADATFAITAMQGTSPTTITVTPAATVIGFISTPDGGTKESVVWHGGSTTGVTSLILNLYKMNTTTGVTSLVSSSANIVSSVANPGSGVAWNYYDFGTDVTAAQGNVYAVEMAIQGSNYTVVGIPNHWVPSNTSVYPNQIGATRTNYVSADTNKKLLSQAAVTSNSSASYTGAAGATVLVAVNTQLAGGSSYTAWTTRTMTYNGTAMTNLGVVNANNTTDGWVQLFGLIGCATGSADTIAWNIAGGTGSQENLLIQASSFNNVGSFGSVVTNAASSTAQTTSSTLTGPIGGALFAAFMSQNSTGSNSIAAEASWLTARNDTANNSSTYNLTGLQEYFLTPSGLAAAAITATGTGGQFYGVVAVPLNAPTMPAAPSMLPVNYSANVPWFGLAGSTNSMVLAPYTQEFTASGAFTFNIPSDYQVAGMQIDIIALGAGGGGQGCWALYVGNGGAAGSYATATLTYGTTIPLGTTTISGSIGVGGAGGTAYENPGSNGGNTTVTGISSWGGLTANGGAGGSGTFGAAYDGASPSNETLSGITYYGGAQQNVTSSNGNAPGGAGSGGTVGFGIPYSGGSGANGAVWFRAYA